MDTNQKVTKYPKNMNNINIGMVFFAVIAIYVVISVITYLRKDHIVGYEVKEGSLSSNNIYEAVALRKEEIVESDTAGYVNYFASEGGRVAVGNLVYTVDESGQLLDYLKSQGSEEVALSDDDMSELRTQMVSFDASFDPHNFHTVYDFKVSLSGTVQKLSNNSILSNIQSLNSGGSTLAAINYKYAGNTGIVVYSTDGYEDKTLQTLTVADFDEPNYNKNQLINNNLVKVGDPVYKLCTSEEWSIVIHENDQDKVNELVEREYVKVRFIKNQDESWGKVTAFTNADGDTFVQLTFTNSMITFCRDRFLNVELITEDESGLKIPNSAIVNKNFYLVPKDYVIKNNDNSSTVLRVKYDEQGNETTELVTVTVYNETETEYYLDTQVLRSGDSLIKPESTERYTVSKTDSLIGVYNINKGYADFRQIKILYQNEEYAIVKSNTMYGLSVYDYIVLDSSTIGEDGNAKKSSNLSIDKDDSKDEASEGASEETSEESSEENSEEGVSADTEETETENSESAGSETSE
ncbi:HlyD family efflux transporter periplasmic adaptor subunit [Butyrivibrio proteoclasticus]|uniref:HlyD family efflux transporter periplasmic adaptor subunit n=1 Tax=Butyrivibrio proteoclasticus TaxID=43305 RepID=UPI000AF41E3A|nr:HlyD family efflux transporter periplasmic adaptor subunit [Butyrivibrio proteoclasticus]